jgi:hypothetical protein
VIPVIAMKNCVCVCCQADGAGFAGVVWGSLGSVEIDADKLGYNFDEQDECQI